MGFEFLTAALCLTTFSTRDAALEAARTLVQERLIACANLVPRVTSVYAWKGEVAEEEETLMLMKTARECVPALTARLLELHSYEMPELIVIDIVDGSAPYLAWLEDAVRPLGKPAP